MSVPSTRRRRSFEDVTDPSEAEAPPKARVRREPERDDDAVMEDPRVTEDEEKAHTAAETGLAKARRPRADDEETGDETSAYDESLIARGWKKAKEARPESTGDWTNDFRWNTDAQVIKFLVDEPWGYTQHWVQREGKRGFPCVGKGCPLCAIGVKVSQKLVFSILNLSKSPATVENLQIGVQLADQIEALGADPRTGPLSRMWWAFSATDATGGRKGRKNYVLTPIKDRDLAEDWEIDLDDALDAVDAAVVPSPKEAITWTSKDELRKIAAESVDKS